MGMPRLGILPNLILILGLGLLVSPALAAAPTGAKEAPKIVHANKNTNITSFEKRIVTLNFSGTDVECKKKEESDPVDRCDIEVKVTPSDGTSLCKAEIDGRLVIHGNTKPKIVWRIVLQSPSSNTYAFHASQGILVVNDVGQVGSGGAGDAYLHPSDTQYFHRKMARHDHGKVAVYVPVVIETAGDNITMCAATDPTIFNE